MRRICRSIRCGCGCVTGTFRGATVALVWRHSRTCGVFWIGGLGCKTCCFSWFVGKICLLKGSQQRLFTSTTTLSLLSFTRCCVSGGGVLGRVLGLFKRPSSTVTITGTGRAYASTVGFGCVDSTVSGGLWSRWQPKALFFIANTVRNSSKMSHCCSGVLSDCCILVSSTKSTFQLFRAYITGCLR